MRNKLSFALLIFTFLVIEAYPQSNSNGTYLQKIRAFHSSEEFARMTQGAVKVKRDFSREDRDRLIEALSFRVAPLSETTVIASIPEVIVMGTKRGAYLFTMPERNLHYLAGMRWLPDDQVTGVGFEDKGRIVWIETAKGFSRVEFKEMTLAEKSKRFVERIRARHVRHGLTADSHLKIPGDLASNQMVSSDNDGLWTAMYVAAECYRYKVTGETSARDHARQGLQALLRLEEITGIPGFPARSFIKVGVDEQPKDGEWHDTPGKQWRWKGDTSSDEIVGHYFVYPIYYDLIADDAEKQKIRAVISRITDHILDHGYHLVDLDGKPTRWGWWAPEEIWADPDETGLRALHLLSHLRVAHYLTGNPRYQAAYEELIDKHRYHLLLRNQKINYPTKINHSDDELAFLSYFPLFLYEKDQKLREIYLESLNNNWLVERPERNPLWNFMYAICSGSKEYDREASLRTLQEIPMDLISWTVVNSHRADVPLDPLVDRFKRRQALIVLPYDELPMSKWNGNPYRLDGGNGGRSEDDGAYFLLPYWLGRYYKLINE